MFFFSFDKEGLVLYRGFRSVTAVIKAAVSSACFHYNQTGQRTNRTTKILRKELKRMTGNKIMSRWTAMARHHALPSRIILSQPPLSTAFCEELWRKSRLFGRCTVVPRAFVLQLSCSNPLWSDGYIVHRRETTLLYSVQYSWVTSHQLHESTNLALNLHPVSVALIFTVQVLQSLSRSSVFYQYYYLF